MIIGKLMQLLRIILSVLSSITLDFFPHSLPLLAMIFCNYENHYLVIQISLRDSLLKSSI